LFEIANNFGIITKKRLPEQPFYNGKGQENNYTGIFLFTFLLPTSA
jgi:hypothetical protein